MRDLTIVFVVEVRIEATTCHCVVSVFCVRERERVRASTMALKFLNKKGWHTGSLRNIENVWKAEQKHEAEQKKLEELRKQIQEERERNEFRLLQEKAGLVP